ncbi:SbcC/MukB-like Walker B domain-containing protein [Streptomyces sp. NPDC048674]|uniref:SbcC/MukB-like Walker B domain-containing protein n=1 Tax=Streptomyces sp. NPDC048674 TaxID=3155491 RepID=UPI00343B09CB
MNRSSIPARWSDRWCLAGAGVENVGQFPREVLDCPSGRILVTGPNGTGKTTLLEKLCPHLLDPTTVHHLSSGKNRGTTLESLMKYGSSGRRRIGYVWLSFRPPQTSQEAATGIQHYGLRLDYAAGTSPSVTRAGFRMPLVPGSDVADLSLLNIEEFTQYVSGHGGTVFESLDGYVADLAERVFGCAPARLQQIARRIKKVRNPGLLADLTPLQAEQELHEVLPRVDPEVLRVTRQALAAAEATRTRYVRAEKTAALLHDLSAAWLHACARTVLGETQNALEHTQALLQAEGEIRDVNTHAEASERTRAELASLVDQLDVTEREAASRAQALDRDAASSDVARAREKAEADEVRHQTTEALFEAHCSAAARAADRLEAVVNSVRGVVESVAKGCAEAGASGVVASPVRMRRVEQAPVTIGTRSFGSLTEITAETDSGSLEESVAALAEAERSMRQRGKNATLLMLAHETVGELQEDGKTARAKAISAAESADRAISRHRAAHDDARAKVAALSESVQAWTDSAQSTVRMPLFDVAAIEIQARAWRQEAEFTAAVADAASLGKRVSTGAADAVSRGRQRSEHYRQLAAATRKDAAQAADQARLWASGKLPPLPGPAWLETADESDCFALAVDWRPAALPAGPVRNAAEAAMASAGLLSAQLSAQGLTGGEGWQVEPRGPELPVEDSLASVLTSVPGHRLGNVAEAILRRIAYAPTTDGKATTQSELVIGADGTYRCGPLLARPPHAVHGAPVAQHIGSEARHTAALRRAAELRRESERLELKAARLARTAARLADYAELLKQLADRYPHEQLHEATKAETIRTECSVAEQEARNHACTEDRLAQEKEAQARHALQRWRQQAADYGLPDSIHLVGDEFKASGRRAEFFERAAHRMRGVSSLLEEVLDAAQHAADTHGQAQMTARATLDSYGQLSDARASLEACQQRSGMDELTLVQEAVTARQAHTEVRERLGRVRTELQKAGNEASAAGQAQKEAARRLQDRRPRAEASVAAVRRCLTLDGLAEALSAPGGDDAADPETVASWLKQLHTCLQDVPRPTAGLDACGDALRLHLAAASDEEWHIGHGLAPERMPSHQLSLAGRRLSPHAAAAMAAERRAEAERVYSRADENALEKFILGQIPAAVGTAWVELQDWVAEVNEQMKLAAASSGVGVQISLALRRDLSPSLVTIHHLTCEKSDAERTPEEQRRIGQELLAVMRLGETQADAAAGRSSRADRLAEAIDIRNWIKVKYKITRSGTAKQETWGARGVTVSKGESRLIVLAPMLAALAAEYRDLPPHAARLCALDEVPGDVDEQGRDGIAAYLESLDLDLMSTSHNWDGSPGAWDGIDIFELEKAPNDTVVAFPVRAYGPLLQQATGHHIALPAATP